MKPNFNINDWLPEKELQGKPQPLPAESEAEAVERAIAAIEQQVTDITTGYSNWRDIGFALTHFGEAGRSFYHRVSRFHPEYDPKECDKQFNRCLKSKGSGISLGTFFHLVKQAGIIIPKPEPKFPEPEYPEYYAPVLRPVLEEEEEEVIKGPVTLPTLPPQVFQNLPNFLKKAVEQATSDEERDVLLLGSLASLSACLPNIYGIYDGKRIFPNLYLFVTAPPSAGKGRLATCKNLVLPIHRAKRAESKLAREEYEKELAEYNASKNDSREKPLKPAEKMLFIPANNSTTGMFQLLHDNDSQGLIFETEGDSLTNAFRSDYGNYSDGFRKAFHHEPISYYRRTEREYVSLEEPKLSTVLSGTPRQINSLIPSAENGLFSRFLFYYFNLKFEWKDVFANEGTKDIEQHFLELGEEFFGFHQQLTSDQPMKIIFSKSQRNRFNAYFSMIQLKYKLLQPEEYVATVRRLALICFRMAMIFTALRYMEDQQGGPLRQCDERDFNSIMEMARVLIRHSSHVFYRLPEGQKVVLRNSAMELCLNALPATFTTQDYVKQALDFKIPGRTAQRYLNEFIELGIIQRVKRGGYVLKAV